MTPSRNKHLRGSWKSHILITTDERFCRPISEKRDRFRRWLRDWSPKILGVLVLVCALGGVVRSSLNVPSLPSDAFYTSYIDTFVGYRIAAFALVLAGFSVAFFFYTLAREEIVKTRIILWAENAAAIILNPIREPCRLFHGQRDWTTPGR